MAGPGRTQKQIAEKYKGNLDYYNKSHPYRRARFWVSFLAIFGGLAGIIAFQVRGHTREREAFFTSGKISSNHAGFANDCRKCHVPATVELRGLTIDRARPEKVRFDAVALEASFHQTADFLKHTFHDGLAFAPIDHACLDCHRGHTLHQPSVVDDHSCSSCHQEHRGPGPMAAVTTKNCAACHNSSNAMEAAADKGAHLPAAAFQLRPKATDRVVFEPPRPPRGRTQVFASFSNGHPVFQIDYEKLRDPDTLRFNHQRHEAADIPLIGGKKLDCDYCHKPDADGRYYQRVSFAANCQACHSLQFDARNPELTIPHGNAATVRAFLRTLPTQYAELAIKQKGLTRPNDIQSFVSQQMVQLRDRVRSGEDFERQVFFTANPYKAQRETGERTRSSFHGCAFCHEVKAASAGLTPIITKPILVDRWLPGGRFDHAKHTDVSCAECHHASQSRETSDILLPSKESCAVCHSPKGKVASECIVCHTYHAPSQIAAAGPRAGGSLKQMLLGGEAR